MLELMFAIVIIGILASVAIPKLAATRTDAIISKGKTQVAAIRNGIIIQKGLMLLKGGSGFPNNLDDSNASEYNQIDKELFTGASDGDILQNPIISGNKSGHWMKIGVNKYRFYVTNSESVDFDYTNTDGSFDCAIAVTHCKALTR